MPYFDWNNTSIHYSDEGSGEPLVFLHGLGGRSENWVYQRRYFSAQWRVLCPDLPGQGRSQGKDVPFFQYWEMLLALLDHLGIESVSICGLSTGARVGIGLASHHPERVGHLVIVNAFVHLSDEDRIERLALYDLLSQADGRDPWARGLLDMMGVPKDTSMERGFLASAESMDAAHIHGLFHQVADFDQRPELSSVRAKTLLLSGENDGFIPSYCMPEMETEIPHTTLLRLPGLGHLPYLEAPGIFNAALEPFLRS